MGEGEGEVVLGETLEFTSTWAVAAVCTVIVAVSLAVDRLFHFFITYFRRTEQRSLVQALQKIKDELMVLGFISLLLTVLQGTISRICVPEHFVSVMLPCPLKDASIVDPHPKRGESFNHCASKNKRELLSVEAIHHLHIFIFVLAVVHVLYSLLTILFGQAKIRQWRHWEQATVQSNPAPAQEITHVKQHHFVQDHLPHSSVTGWMYCFFKQFYGSVSKSDYNTLRIGFITTHCQTNPNFNFHKYMMRALEDDFKVVVGIRWYLWIFVVIFLLLNINGWHFYFRISFVPLILLLIIGTKLEHIICQLAKDVVEKEAAIEGNLVARPSDEHFWFNKPGIVLYLIHFILFQNAFELAFFFWILFQYGWNSCIMEETRYIVPRLVIGVLIQVLCSYSTLPLYAIVTQMGSSFKKAIFEDHVQVGLLRWAEKAKMKRKNVPVNGLLVHLKPKIRTMFMGSESGSSGNLRNKIANGSPDADPRRQGEIEVSEITELANDH